MSDGLRGHNDVCAQLLDVDFGPPLHSFVIPGEMHHIEEEVVQTFRLLNQPASSCPAVEGKQLPPPPSTIAGAAVPPTLDPAAVSAAVSSWGVSFLVIWFAHQQESQTVLSSIAISIPLTYEAYDPPPSSLTRIVASCCLCGDGPRNRRRFRH
eukprot:COSAG02_NODE_1530_length_12086_cov_80.633103_4_plen_153_part_00